MALAPAAKNFAYGVYAWLCAVQWGHTLIIVAFYTSTCNVCAVQYRTNGRIRTCTL